VHVGFAISRVDEAEVERTYQALKDLDQRSSLAAARRNIESVRPLMQIFEVSAKSRIWHEESFTVPARSTRPVSRDPSRLANRDDPLNAPLEITFISCAVLGFRHGFDYDHIAAISDIEPLSNSEVKNSAPEYDEFRKRSLKIDENRGLRSVSSPAMSSLIENPNLGDGGSLCSTELQEKRS